MYRENWGKSGGTLVEKRAISRRRYRSDENFIFIIRMPGETSRPFLEEESIYHDLNKYPIEQSINGIIRMVKEHREGELNLLNHNSSPREETSNLILFSNLKSWLKSDFYENGLFEGHFGRNKNRALALDVKWQSKDGEAVNSLHYPKYPYYYTFWGYRAALLIAPELVQQYKDKTIKAIRTHYGGDRWIKVERQSSFTEGPITKVRISETVRHTARAANILLFLDPKERLVSQTAWELLNEQKMLQNDDGAWLEFRSEGNSESIWSTIYVYQFLSSLLLIKDINVPDERQAFLDRVIIPIQRSEKYLVKHWQLNRWTPGNNIHWTEGACAVLIEICPYFKNESLLIDCYSVLRNLISPGWINTTFRGIVVQVLIFCKRTKSAFSDRNFPFKWLSYHFH